MGYPNVRSGLGCAIDQARAGLPAIPCTFSMGVPLEHDSRAFAPDTPLRAIRGGSVCSVNARGEVIPFSESAQPAGLLDRIHQDHHGKPRASVIVRCAVCVRIAGLRATSRIEADVFATADGTFNIEGRGARVAALLSVESAEKGYGIIGIKPPNDQRPFVFGHSPRSLEESGRVNSR